MKSSAIVIWILPNVPFCSPENIRKPLVFWCFQGNEKRTSGRKGLTNNLCCNFFNETATRMSSLYKQYSENTFQFFSIRMSQFWFYFAFLRYSFRSCRSQVFYRIVVLRNLTKVIGKLMIECNYNLLHTATLLKRTPLQGIFCEFLRNFSEQFFYNT